MKRRTALAGALGIGIAATTPASAQGRRRLSLKSVWSEEKPLHSASAQRVAAGIAALSGDALQISLSFAAPGESPLSVFDSVSTGETDMYFGDEGDWAPRHPAFAFFGAVPFGLTAEENTAWRGFAGGQIYWDALSARFNIKALHAASTGPARPGWFRRLPERFAGTRLQAGGMWAETLRTLGAETFPVDAPASALRSGAIDGAFAGTLAQDAADGLADTATLVSPLLAAPDIPASLGINLDVWASLTDAEREIIQTCCAMEVGQSLSEAHARNAATLKALRAEGLQTRSMPQPLQSEIFEAALAHQQSIADTDGESGDIYWSFNDLRRNVAKWTAESDGLYFSMRGRALS
ncbi:MAG: hypothetical protein AAFY59_07250 [Pseudomonadota bacterium]